jgi:hypothetical protein
VPSSGPTLLDVGGAEHPPMAGWHAQKDKIPERPCRTDWSIREYRRLMAEHEQLSGAHADQIDAVRREVERAHRRIDLLRELVEALAGADVLD